MIRLPLLLGALCIATASGANDSPAPDLSSFRAAIHSAVSGRVIAGAAWWVEHAGHRAHGSDGFRLKTPQEERVTDDTIFDLASLTKVIATTPCIMLLVERGQVELEAAVRNYLPEFSGEGRERITVRHLLTHTSGLKPSLPQEPEWSGGETGIRMACEPVPAHAPDTVFRYSDINFILLGEIVRRVSGQPLDRFARQQLFAPLGMRDTGFTPDAALRPCIAATANDGNGVMLRGIVHDPTARRMGGVAGHAGLFVTAADVARYARMLLNGGELDGVRIFKAETVKRMTAIHTPPAMPDRRALGWDVDTRFSKPRGGFPIGTSFGHTGFTGTCLWIDPGSRTFYVFLSSRLHETDPASDVRKLYETLGTELAKAVGK
jgi:CubicO group peptidase (beta-lactamase class C family)